MAQTVKNLNAGDLGLILGVGRSPEEGKGYQSNFLAGEFHGQKSLEGYSPWGRKESDMTERLSLHLAAKKILT